MPLEELFEAAWNDEPIVSDEVAVLGDSVEVALPSRPPQCSGFHFLQGWCHFQEWWRQENAVGVERIGADRGGNN
jgi:hypothetical protein